MTVLAPGNIVSGGQGVLAEPGQHRAPSAALRAQPMFDCATPLLPPLLPKPGIPVLTLPGFDAVRLQRGSPTSAGDGCRDVACVTMPACGRRPSLCRSFAHAPSQPLRGRCCRSSATLRMGRRSPAAHAAGCAGAGLFQQPDPANLPRAAPRHGRRRAAGAGRLAADGDRVRRRATDTASATLQFRTRLSNGRTITTAARLNRPTLPRRCRRSPSRCYRGGADPGRTPTRPTTGCSPSAAG